MTELAPLSFSYRYFTTKEVVDEQTKTAVTERTKKRKEPDILVARFIVGVLVGMYVTLEYQKMNRLSTRNRDLEAALKEVMEENKRLRQRNSMV